MNVAASRSEEPFRDTFENAAVGISHVALDGRWLRVNQRLCEIVGYTEEELMERTFGDITYQEDLEADWAQAKRLLAGEIQTYSMEKRYRRKNGSLIWVNLTVSLQRDESGAPVNFISVVEDIHGRKQAEEAQHRLQEQLAHSAAEFRQIADSLPQLVWVTRPDGHHEWYNRRWYEYTGATFEQSSGEQWSLFFHPDDISESRKRWAHSLATGEPYEVEYRCRRHDGTWRWFLGRAEPIRSETGAIVRWFGTCTDIHEQKVIEDALRASNQDLERFAYVAGHDLQEPLRIVTSYSQLFARRYRGALDDKADEYLTFILGATQRMNCLIQDLLIYARATGNHELQLQPTDANTALAMALANLRSRIDETSAALTWDQLPVIPAVEGLLVQVFQNLIGNAIKYGRQSVAPQVHVSAERHGTEWIFSVRDNGEGIMPEHTQTVFQLFSRFHGPDVSGSGIGLATVKRIVERHGGRVWLESEPGIGSTFFFSLPA